LSCSWALAKRAIYDEALYARFITFCGYRRRHLLDDDRANRVVFGVLDAQLDGRKASCVGFVIMPDHVHAIVWFPTKLRYIHENPVRAGLVAEPYAWSYSSPRFYEQSRSVGVPIQWIA